VKDLTQQPQTLVQHVDPHMWESERDQPSMQRLVAFHKDPKSIILMEFFEGLAIGLFVMFKVNTQICVC
jgi:hypothetical protein